MAASRSSPVFPDYHSETDNKRLLKFGPDGPFDRLRELDLLVVVPCVAQSLAAMQKPARNLSALLKDAPVRCRGPRQCTSMLSKTLR